MITNIIFIVLCYTIIRTFYYSELKTTQILKQRICGNELQLPIPIKNDDNNNMVTKAVVINTAKNYLYATYLPTYLFILFCNYNNIFCDLCFF